MQKSRWYKYHFIGEYDDVSGMLSVTSFITNKKLVYKPYSNKYTAKRGFEQIAGKLLRGREITFT